MTPTTRLRMIEFVAPGVEAIAGVLGLFEHQGLELDVIRPRSAAEKREVLMGGDGDAMLTAIDNAIAWGADGDDMRLVAQVERTTVLDLVAQPGIAGLADLRGHTLAVDAVDTGFAIVLRKILLDHGLNSGDYELVSVGGINERLEALLEDGAAAALLGPPWNVRAADAGLRILTTVEDSFPNFPGIGLLVRDSRRAELADAVERYLAALQAAMSWADHAGPDGTRARLIEAGFDERSARSLVAVWPETLAPSRHGVELLYAIRRELGVLPRDAPTAGQLIVSMDSAGSD